MPCVRFSASVRSGRQRLLPKIRGAALARGLAALAACVWLTAAAVFPVKAADNVSASPPSIPAVKLGVTTLYTPPSEDKPTLTLALSVEYPTVGAQYPTPESEKPPGGALLDKTRDSSYSTDREYLGYYDAESCYRYIDNPPEQLDPLEPYTKADYKRFKKSGPATRRRCTEAFSGNFLNWASSSAIDMIRLALTGGDRYIDKDGLTILQRAVLPSGPPPIACMWNNALFPAKRLTRDGGAYWGAVPRSMITQEMNTGGKDIYVGQKWNRIYFGTDQAGDCEKDVSSVDSSGDWTETYTSSYTLGSHRENRNDGYRGIRTNPNPPATLPAGKFNSDGFFFARVEVCNSARGALEDERNYAFCQRYPNNKYKPTGAIQRYADQMRLAVFGYLLDMKNDRYGGVLRAPMKYVGQRHYGTDGRLRGSNPKAEWDAETGVFPKNPDGMSNYFEGPWPAVSGVINYLNKFGRTLAPGEWTGAGIFGRYKKFDPVGELHYEVLRYLQGIGPFQDALKDPSPRNDPARGPNFTPTWYELADGFPFYGAERKDPFIGRRSSENYSCLKNTILVIGDVNTHDQSVPTMLDGYIKNNNMPNINHWRYVVQSFENNSSDKNYRDGNGDEHPIRNPNPANSQAPASQLIGTAYWANTHDIRGRDWTAGPGPDLQRPGLRVKTMVFDVNEGGLENNPEQRHNKNQFFLAAKYGGFETDPNNPAGKPYNTKGNPFRNEKTGADDNNVWQKSDEPGEAASYYMVDLRKESPGRAVLGMLDDMFRVSATPLGLANSSLSTGSELVSDTVIYTARYAIGNWTGDIVAKPLSSNDSHALVVGTDLWSAARRLDSMEDPKTRRKVFVGRANSNKTAGVVANRFAEDKLDATQDAQLNRPAPGADPDNRGAMRLWFLLGDREHEAMFRKRKSLLGDIINSNIAYSGLPRKRFEGPGYDAFYKKYAVDTPRKTAVFAGANDGMLHAFDADTGDELFAYIPSWLVPKLSALTEPDYPSHHQAYVDGPSVVAEARTGSSDETAEDWKTVLVSGTGGGGSGVFALDVSDPADFKESRALWEFTRADDVNIGEVVGAPKIVKMKIASATTTTAAQYRWFAAVASGVNNYVPDSDGRFSSTGKPALFLLALDKAPGVRWEQGTNYYRVDIPIDQNLRTRHATGVVNFSALYGDQQEMTDVYFGDLHGQVWRLQFAGKDPGVWSEIDQLSFFKKANGTAKPLYQARARFGAQTVQPISAAPTLLVGPKVAGRQTFYVVFGTGKYLEASDNKPAALQTVYGLFDSGDPAGKTLPNQDTAVIESGWQHLRWLIPANANRFEVDAFRWGYPEKVRPNSYGRCDPCAGWYFELREEGERVDQPGRDLGALTVAINSKIPNPNAPAVNKTSCSYSAGAGGGRQYVVNVNTGKGGYSQSTVGLLGAPLFVSNSAETVIGQKDSAGRRIVVTTHRRLAVGQDATQATDASNDANSTYKVTSPVLTGRLGWRRIPNYQELRRAQPANQTGANH